MLFASLAFDTVLSTPIEVVRDRREEAGVVIPFSTLPLKKGYVTATRWTKVKNIQQKVKIDLPVQIHQYNKLMGGVDLVDGIRGKAKRTLMTKRWTLKVFHYLLEISIFNVFTLQKKSGKDVGTYTQFKSRLCSQLIDSRTPQTRTEGHYPRRSDTSRDCAYCSSRICSSKRVRSSIYCSKCGVFLCIDPCFEQYHENIDKFSAPVCNNHTFATDSHTPPKKKRETEALYSYKIAKIKANPGVLSNSVFLGCCCCIFPISFRPLAG